ATSVTPRRADVDGDGRADLVFATEGEVFAALRTPTGYDVVQSPGPATLTSVEVGHFDTDAFIDVLVRAPDTLTPLLGDVGGRFHMAAPIFVSSTSSLVLDYDEDGDSDILLPGHGLLWLPSNGDGTFEPLPPPVDLRSWLLTEPKRLDFNG